MRDLEFSEDTGFLKSEQMTILGIKESISMEQFEQEVAEIEKIREVLQNIGNAAEIQEGDSFYCVLVFKNASERANVLNSIGLEDNKFQHGSEFISAVIAKK